jgi:choline dehydrogenase-like flavoprotein
MHALFDASLRRAGLGHFEPRFPDDAAAWRSGVEGGKHHMGTTRMHPDPRQGVVDADARVHGCPNLHVAGSSVFPTGGYANPTLTLVALAVRLAGRLHQVLSEN